MYLNEKSDDVNNPILVVHDSVSEGVWAIFVKRKSESSYSVKKVSDIIKRLGYSKIIIKSDQEPSLISRIREALTAIERIRGRSSVSAKHRFCESVLYNVS